MKSLNDCLPLIQRQHGLISRAQLRKAGATNHDIRYALNTARIERIFPGVYRLFGALPTVFSRFMAVSLWATPNGCLSHLTAAWVHGLELSLDAPLQVDALFVHGTKAVPPPNVQVHLSRNFSPKSESTTINGISCTTLPRTLIDLAALFDIGTPKSRSTPHSASSPSVEAPLLAFSRSTATRALRAWLHFVSRSNAAPKTAPSK